MDLADRPRYQQRIGVLADKDIVAFAIDEVKQRRDDRHVALNDRVAERAKRAAAAVEIGIEEEFLLPAAETDGSKRIDKNLVPGCARERKPEPVERYRRAGESFAGCIDALTEISVPIERACLHVEPAGAVGRDRQRLAFQIEQMLGRERTVGQLGQDEAVLLLHVVQDRAGVCVVGRERREQGQECEPSEVESSRTEDIGAYALIFLGVFQWQSTGSQPSVKGKSPILSVRCRTIGSDPGWTQYH